MSVSPSNCAYVAVGSIITIVSLVVTLVSVFVTVKDVSSDSVRSLTVMFGSG